jgi:MFS transporter, DHA1 family, multidrug resistance protein
MNQFFSSPGMKKTRISDTFIIVILGLLMTISPFAIDLYLPAFSNLAKDFGTTPSRISLSITSYFIGFAIGQLLYGPLLDRYGRKKPLYFGLSLFVIACIGCMLSRSIEMLITLRFVQAVGGCVAGVAALTMVRDFFPVKESAKIISLLILILGVSPLLAPTIGSLITASLSWHWVFIFLIIVTVVVIALVIFFLPDGHQPDPTVSLNVKPMTAIFGSILKNPQFLTYAVAGAFSFATLFLYVTGSPIIFMEIFHVSPQVYGGIFALLSVGFIGSNQLNIVLLRKYRSEQIFNYALISQVIFTILFFIGAMNNWYGLVPTIVMLFLCLTCLGFTYPNASALALTPFDKNIGSASALLGFLQIGIAGVVSVCVGLFDSKDARPIIAMMAITAFIALLIFFTGRRKFTPLSASGNMTIPGH